MALNADQLEAFLAIVQAGSYHRAAEALFISQSAVTQRVQALEAVLARRLFVRAGRGVALTEAGQQLAAYARARQADEAALLAAFRGEAEGLTGRLAIASGSAEAHTWLVPLLAELSSRSPGLGLSLAIDDALDAVGLLESARADLVIAETPVTRRGLGSQRLGETAYVLVIARGASAGWPDCPDGDTLATARVVDFHPGDRITLDHLAHCLPGADWSALGRHYVNDTRAILSWVLAGGGMSVLPRHFVGRYLTSGELRVLYPHVESRRTLYAIAPEGPVPGASAWLVQRLKQGFAALAAPPHERERPATGAA